MTATPPVQAAGPPPDPGPRGALALAVAAAVDSVPGARRSRGTGIEVATQYRRGKAIGVRLCDDCVEVHVVAERPDVTCLAEDVHAVTRRALDAIGDRRPVAVFLDDLDVISLTDRGQ